jgi:hypothetical protein
MVKTLSESIGEDAFSQMVDDPTLFIRAFESRTPWEYQDRILRQATERKPDGKYRWRRVIISMPRQNAKSTLSAWLALHRLFTQPDQEVVSVANDTAQAGIILNDARRIVSGSDVLYSQLDDFGLTREQIKLKNGNRWLIKGSESIASRGLRPSLALYDELGWASDRMLFDVLSAGQAAQSDPQIIVTSTVGMIKDGPLWDLFQLAREGDPSTLLVYETTNLSPLITPEYLESQRAALPAHVFAREHQNLWSEGGDVVCSESDWKKAIADGDPRRGDDPGPTWAFLDLGIVHDESVLAIMRRLNSGKHGVLAMETWQGSSAHPVEFTALKTRLEELCISKFHVKKLNIEAPQGYALAEMLRLSGVRTEILSPTAKSNQEHWGALITSLRNGTINLPDDARLRRQLLTLTIESGPVGWKVVDVPAIHNDRAVAISGALAMILYEDTHKGWSRPMGRGPVHVGHY